MNLPANVSKHAHNLWDSSAAGYGAVAKFFEKTPGVIDRHWRWVDFVLNRNYGGLLGSRLGMDGYSIISLLLPLLAMFFLLAGPTGGWRGAFGVALGLVGGVALILVWRRLAAAQKTKRADWNSVAALHLGLGLILILIVWFSSTDANRRMDHGLYRHSFLVVGGVLYGVMIPVAWLLARRLFREKDHPGLDFRAALRRTQLFRHPIVPKITRTTIVRALVNAPL
jgi:hypothetical protein